MTGLRLGIDMDGVIADFNHGWTWRYNRDFPQHTEKEELHPDLVVEWDAPLTLTHFRHIDDFWAWARTCAEGRSLFHGLDPYPGALEAVRSLHAEGHDIVIVTTKPDFSVGDTYDWLDRHEVPRTEVHIVDDKTQVHCDLYLDDADHNLTALARHRFDATVCRYVRPWNSAVEGTVDVHQWDDFVNAVRTHAN